MPEAQPVADVPRDCRHSCFPLRKRCRVLRGKIYGEWTKKIKHVRIAFGACSLDPTGERAWQRYEAERESWQRGENPREGRGERQSFDLSIVANPAWLLTGPLAQAGVAVINEGGRLMCMKCRATWTVRLRSVPRRLLQCPCQCTRKLTRAVEEALAQARNPDAIHWQDYQSLKRAKREGWKAAPQNVDAEAEVEGKAIVDLAKLRIKPASRRKTAITMKEAAATGYKGARPMPFMLGK